MAEVKGIDFAWDKPSPAAILKAGAHWGAGYISFDPTKDLTQSEVHSYVSAGIPIVLASESTATRALTGMHSGIFDAQYARNRLASLGMKDAVVHFAVDTDADWNQVQPYFEGVLNQWQSKRQIGVYGGLKVIEGAHAWGLKYLWQTDAWSGGVWSPYATIRQEGGTLFGGQADWDDAITPDWGQWPRFVAPVPTPNSTVKYEENDMIAYFDIPANTPRLIPVEPAGTDAKPAGGAKNGAIWLEGVPTKGESGTLTVTYRQGGKWQAGREFAVSGEAGKWYEGLPTTPAVDVIKIECTVDFTAYVLGRQVA